jgi:uncharacterized membrane protein
MGDSDLVTTSVSHVWVRDTTTERCETPEISEHSDDGRDMRPTWTVATGRVEAFSDGVLAVSATLLVLDLKTPEDLGDAGVWLVLAHQLPTLAAYVTSFLTILIFWINHHAVFHTITRVDRWTLLVNGVLLLLVSFISYVTSVLGAALQHGQHS